MAERWRREDEKTDLLGANKARMEERKDGNLWQGNDGQGNLPRMGLSVPLTNFRLTFPTFAGLVEGIAERSRVARSAEAAISKVGVFFPSVPSAVGWNPAAQKKKKAGHENRPESQNALSQKPACAAEALRRAVPAHEPKGAGPERQQHERAGDNGGGFGHGSTDPRVAGDERITGNIGSSIVRADLRARIAGKVLVRIAWKIKV